MLPDLTPPSSPSRRPSQRLLVPHLSSSPLGSPSQPSARYLPETPPSPTFLTPLLASRVIIVPLPESNAPNSFLRGAGSPRLYRFPSPSHIAIHLQLGACDGEFCEDSNTCRIPSTCRIRLSQRHRGISVHPDLTHSSLPIALRNSFQIPNRLKTPVNLLLTSPSSSSLPHDPTPHLPIHLPPPPPLATTCPPRSKFPRSHELNPPEIPVLPPCISTNSPSCSARFHSVARPNLPTCLDDSHS